MNSREASIQPPIDLTKPLKTLPYERGTRPPIPEFQLPGNFSLVSAEKALVINRGDPSLISDGFNRCQAVVLEGQGGLKLGLVHVALDYIKKEQIDEIKKIGGEAQAIMLRGEQSYKTHKVKDQLEKLGIKVVRIVELNTGNRHWAVMYDETEDSILIENQSLSEVEYYAGFNYVDDRV